MMTDMDSYTDFAAVYDIFMDNVPYGEWADEVEKVLKSKGVSDGLVLDLGCGTGTLTEALASKGYDMIGIDASEHMLFEAIKKRDISGNDILYLCQDMCSFELYGTVRATVCLCDCINYIIERKDLEKVFRLVENYLDPGGLFIFDVNTDYKYKEVIGETTIAENREDASFIWDNFYDEDTGINEYDLTLFIRDQDGKFERYTETHIQRGYGAEEILDIADKCGFNLISVTDGDTKGDISSETQRLFFVMSISDAPKKTFP